MTSAALLATSRRANPTRRARSASRWRRWPIVDPLVAFDLSFPLSAAATRGCFALSRRFARARSSRALPRGSRPSCAPIGVVAASIACAPVLACMTADASVAGSSPT